MREVKELVKREIRVEDIQQFEDEVSTFSFVNGAIDKNSVAEGLLMLNEDKKIITKLNNKIYEQVIDNETVKFKEIKEGA